MRFPILISVLIAVVYMRADDVRAQTFEVTGVVFTAGDPAEVVPGAAVLVEGTRLGTVSDARGHFVLPGIQAGTYTLVVRHVAYEPVRVAVTVPAELPLRVALVPTALMGDEIIVTASPTGSTARYQAAQAFSPEALQRLGAASLGEILDGASGVFMRSFGSAPARPVIRGMDGDRVLVMQNGERMGDLAEAAADHAIAVDPLMVDRVEIVRGPASLLYGASAIGGVVNLFTEDIPRSWTRGSSGVIALQNATVNAMAAGSGRIVYGADRWAATGNFSARRAGDIRTPEGILQGTFLRTFSGGSGLAFSADGFRGGASVAGLQSVYGLPEGLDDPDERVEIRMDRLSSTGLARWERPGFIEGIELRLNASTYYHAEVEIENEDGVIEEDIELDFHQRSLSSTLTLRHGALGPIGSGAVGLNVQMRELEVGGEEALTPDARSGSLALFVYEEVPIVRGVHLQGGARIEMLSMRARPNEEYPDFSATRTSTTFSGSVGLNYRPVTGLEVGAQLARAFRAPRVEELYADAPHLGAGAYEIGSPDLANEVSTGVDGFATWRQGPVRLEVALFANRIDNFIVYQPTGAIHEPSGLPVFMFEASDAAVLGYEISAGARLGLGFVATGGLDYVRGTRLDDARTPLPFMPPRRWTASLLRQATAWQVGISARFVAAQNRVAIEEDPTNGYALFGAESLFRLPRGGHHIITVRADNMLNVAYRDHLSRVEDRDNPMPGRSFTMTYRWLF
jgi:iron complex outermembrane recepter protein